MLRRGALGLAGALALVALQAAPGLAYPGDPDPNYGVCGDVTADAGTGSSLASAFAAAPDGSSVVAGIGALPGGGRGAVVARFTPNGALDQSFGRGGIVAIGRGQTDSVGGVAVDSTGRVLVAGATAGHATVWRLTHAGAADTAWNTTGAETLPQTGTDAFVDVAARSDGTVQALAAGGALTVLSSAGAPVTGYGSNGTAPAAAGMTVGRLAAQSDGSSYVVGSAGGHAALARYTAAGALDSAFGTAGVATVSFTGLAGTATRTDVGTAVTTLADGTVVLGATSQAAGASGRDLAVAELTTAGAPSSTFGTTGRVVQNFGEDEQLMGLAVTGAGKLLLAGTIGSTTDADVLVSQLNTDGTPDSSFGFGGVLYHDRGGVDTAVGAAMTPMGLLVGGSVTSVPDSRAHFAVTRLKTVMESGPSGYLTDGWGGVHSWAVNPADAPPCLKHGPYWTGWDIARGSAELPDSSGAFILDGWGGLHFTTAYPEMVATPTTSGSPYWTGWDIARSVAVMPDGGSGLVLDGWGGIHTFSINGGTPPTVQSPAYWTGWDIARGIAILPTGFGGYVLDGWGGLHPFGLNGHPAPPAVRNGPYWTGWDIARSVTLTSDGTGGYVMDGWGGMHPFSLPNQTPPPVVTSGPYWTGWDIARGVTSTS